MRLVLERELCTGRDCACNRRPQAGFFARPGNPTGGLVLRMNPVIWIVLVVFGGVAGWIGWRSATRAVYRRSYGRTDAMLADERRRYEIATITRRKRWRIVAAAAYSAGGVVLGLVFLVVISHR